jgi:hypothetical protein
MNLEEKLRASKPESQEPPPFLHTRIMNSLQAPEAAKRSGAPRFRAALVFVSAFVLLISLVLREPKPRQLEIEVPNLPQVSLPPNASLQSEMENLKSDARNAARALASNFLPSEP